MCKDVMEFIAVTSGIADWGLVLLVAGAAVLRLGWYVWKKNYDPHHLWEPLEMTFLRSMVILITGKPANHITWYRVDMVLFGLLLTGIILILRNL